MVRAWSSGFSLVSPGANTKTRLKPELHALILGTPALPGNLGGWLTHGLR